MTLLDSMIIGFIQGFCSIIGSYLAGVYVIKHLEKAQAKGGVWKSLKDRIKKEVERWE